MANREEFDSSIIEKMKNTMITTIQVALKYPSTINMARKIVQQYYWNIFLFNAFSKDEWATIVPSFILMDKYVIGVEPRGQNNIPFHVHSNLYPTYLHI